jgi:hypothetical protein
MITLVVSFLSLITFATIAVMSLHYAFYLYENRKIEDLTRKIQPRTTTDVMQKTYADRGFTSRDMGENVSKTTKSLQPIQEETRRVMGMMTNNGSGWIQNIKLFLTNLRYQFWPQILHIWQNAISLLKTVDNTGPEEQEPVTEIIPASHSDEVFEDEVDRLKQEQINDLVEKVISQTESENQGATFHTNAKTTAKKPSLSDPDQKALFDRLETKLLNKLKEVGLKHFDIWLQLGELYEKYEENEKATEIYNMILKNSEGKEKDFARDRLIAIS